MILERKLYDLLLFEVPVFISRIILVINGSVRFIHNQLDQQKNTLVCASMRVLLRGVWHKCVVTR